MKCKICQKSLPKEEAWHCPHCHATVCNECKNAVTLCDCYGEFELYD